MNNCIKLIASMFLVVFMIAAWPARAETIFLDCPGVGLSLPGPYTIDLTNNTVNNLPANINPTAIDWQKQIGAAAGSGISSATIHSHIDRSSGTISQYVTYQMTSGQIQSSGQTILNCNAVSAPATKF